MKAMTLALTAAVLSSAPAVAAERAIEKQAVVNATLDQAWDAWTTREGITSFFAPDAKVEPRVGGAFSPHAMLWLGYEFHPQRGSDEPFHVIGFGTRIGVDIDP